MVLFGFGLKDAWVDNYQTALSKSSELDRPILLVFTGSDWCKNCIALEKELLIQEIFLQYADKNLVLLRVDFPRQKKNRLVEQQSKTNALLAEKFNMEGIFPFMVMIDNEEKVIAKSGYRKGGLEDYINFFNDRLPKEEN